MNNNLLIILAVIFALLISLKKEDSNNFSQSEISKLKQELITLNNEVNSLNTIPVVKEKQEDDEIKRDVSIEKKNLDRNLISEKLTELSKSVENLIDCHCKKEERPIIKQNPIKKEIKRKQITQYKQTKEPIKESNKIIVINKIINQIPKNNTKKIQDKIIIEDLAIKKPIDLLK